MSSTQTMTTTMNSPQTVRHHPLLRYVGSGSKSSSTKQGTSTLVSHFADRDSSSYFAFPPSPSTSCNDMSFVQHTSFDSSPSSPAWYIPSHRKKTSFRIWLERKYYQYEVTWGPYVLTPGEKVFVNSMVVIMFSLIFYGIIKLSIVQQATGIIVLYLGILVKEGFRTLKSLKDLVIEVAFPAEETETVDWISRTVVEHVNAVTPALSPAET